MAEERVATQVGSASRIIWPDMPPEEARKRLSALLDEWLADDSGYDEETLPDLKRNLNLNRGSGRKLFRD
jgi:hypothetical protein